MSVAPPDVRPVPITVLTGFLGAGKTTLLNRILTGGHGMRVGVLVNDFGSINIDAALVVDVESDVVSLANGCVCCSIRDDLTDAVLTTIERPERPEYLLLEASGVAEPTGIALTFVDDARLLERVRLDSIVCVVDADQVFEAPEVMELKIWQIACADLVILNKCDLVGPDEIARIKAWLDDRLHRYRLIETDYCDVPLEVLLGVGTFSADQLVAPPTRGNGRCAGPTCKVDHDGDHTHEFESWMYETDRAFSLELLRKAAASLPATVYRAKGLVFADEYPGQRGLLHVVGKRVDISPDAEWGEDVPGTRIVAVGAAGALDEDSLAAHFEKALLGGD